MLEDEVEISAFRNIFCTIILIESGHSLCPLAGGCREGERLGASVWVRRSVKKLSDVRLFMSTTRRRCGMYVFLPSSQYVCITCQETNKHVNKPHRTRTPPAGAEKGSSSWKYRFLSAFRGTRDRHSLKKMSKVACWNFSVSFPLNSNGWMVGKAR